MAEDRVSWRRVRHRPPTSRWRDPDFLALIQYVAVIAGVALVIAGSYQLYLFLTSEANPATRLGVCGRMPDCVYETSVVVTGSESDQVHLRTFDDSQDIVVTRTGGATPDAFNVKDSVALESWHGGQYIAVADLTNGAVMQLQGYPPPSPTEWLPELGTGVASSLLAIGLIFWRRHLYASQTAPD